VEEWVIHGPKNVEADVLVVPTCIQNPLAALQVHRTVHICLLEEAVVHNKNPEAGVLPSVHYHLSFVSVFDLTQTLCY
jgi:hypothetical protein